MSHFLAFDTVKYVCRCGSLNPIYNVYFCRHCLLLRCDDCASHEINSHYCGNCWGTMPSAEAKQKKNRCGNCYDCPCCGQTLCVRGTAIQVPSEEEPTKSTVDTLYYLACDVCRWTTKDAGLPNSQDATGPWGELENPMSSQIEELGDYFRLVAIQEKNYAKDKKFVHKNMYLAAGRHGVTHLLPRTSPVRFPNQASHVLPSPVYVAPTEGMEELPEVTASMYDDELIVARSTSLGQRLRWLETQPTDASKLLPIHKELLVKDSMRCRVCERILKKPEYSPVSSKFKIQLNAYYHVPKICLLTPIKSELLRSGEKTRIVLRLENPTRFPIGIKFLPFSFVPLKEDAIEEAKTLSQNPTSSSSIAFEASMGSSITTASQIIKEIRVLPVKNGTYLYNCDIIPPKVEILLTAKVETKESDDDDVAKTCDPNDDPRLITWRKANKAAIYLDVVRRPYDPAIKGSDNDSSVLGVTIEYDYHETIGGQEPQRVRLQSHLLIALDDLSQDSI